MRTLLFAAGAAFAIAVADLAYAATTTIDQVGQRFTQSAILIAPGDTVWFLNFDDVTHNVSVFDQDDNQTDKGLQKPGQTIQHLFDKAGRFKVRCSIHPRMKMVVTVR